LTTNVTAPGLPGVLTQMQALARARREAARDVLINVRASGSGAIGGRAEGGVITKPEISWIGEAGPEAVIPLTDPARAQQVMAEAGLVQPMTINIIVDGQVVERRVVRANENQARQITSNPRSI
jgi:SLT domain-containing protein